MIATRFNPAQMTILKLLDRPINDQEVDEIKDLLVDFFDRKLQLQLAKDMDENHITEADFEALRKGIKPRTIIEKRIRR